MPLTVDRINDIVTGIKNRLGTIYPSSESYTTATGLLGNDISIETPTTRVTENANRSLAWATVSGGSVVTANSPDALPSTALNFDIKASNTVRTITFLNGNIIAGIMEVSPALSAGGYGAPFYVDFIQIDVVEV